MKSKKARAAALRNGYKQSSQSTLTAYGFPKQERTVARNTRPIKSICVSCGVEKWLNWIVSGSYVCDDCTKDARAKRRK